MSMKGKVVTEWGMKRTLQPYQKLIISLDSLPHGRPEGPGHESMDSNELLMTFSEYTSLVGL